MLMGSKRQTCGSLGRHDLASTVAKGFCEYVYGVVGWIYHIPFSGYLCCLCVHRHKEKRPEREFSGLDLRQPILMVIITISYYSIYVVVFFVRPCFAAE